MVGMHTVCLLFAMESFQSAHDCVKPSSQLRGSDCLSFVVSWLCEFIRENDVSQMPAGVLGALEELGDAVLQLCLRAEE